MPYEWVGPVATAATGIAGVTFTWLASRNAGKTQLQLLQEGQKHESRKDTRQERKEVFASFLGLLSDTDKLMRDVGFLISDNWQSAAKKIRFDPKTPLSEEEFIPGPVLEAMDEKVVDEVMAAVMKFVDHFPAVDQRVRDVKLCGSDRAIAAVDAVKSDLHEISGMLQRGHWRLVDRGVEREVLNAFRVDLGYDETALDPNIDAPKGALVTRRSN